MLDYSRYSNPGTARFFDENVPSSATLPLLSVWSSVSDELAALNLKARQAGGEFAQGWVKFIGDRIAKDIAFPAQLAACKNANDVYLAYSQFWQQTAKDYSTEFAAMADAFLGTFHPSFELAEFDEKQRPNPLTRGGGHEGA